MNIYAKRMIIPVEEMTKNRLGIATAKIIAKYVSKWWLQIWFRSKDSERNVQLKKEMINALMLSI